MTVPPSPVHKTNYASEALSLLTSRYQKPRPGGLVTGAAAVAMAPWNLSGSATIFNPSKLSGLVAWYRGDLGVTIGTGVSAWADQSGTGDPNKNLSQATGSKQPTRNTADAAYNNQTTLSFASASSQFLVSGTWATPIPNPSTQFVIGNYDGSSTLQVLIDGIDATNRQTMFNGAGSGTIVSFFAGTQINATVTNNASPMVLCAQYNGASSNLFVSAKTAAASGNAGTNVALGLTLGIHNGQVSFPLNGKVAEVIVYNRALSGSEVAQVMTYAGLRYGITIGP